MAGDEEGASAADDTDGEEGCDDGDDSVEQSEAPDGFSAGYDQDAAAATTTTDDDDKYDDDDDGPAIDADSDTEMTDAPAAVIDSPVVHDITLYSGTQSSDAPSVTSQSEATVPGVGVRRSGSRAPSTMGASEALPQVDNPCYWITYAAPAPDDESSDKDEEL